MIHFNTITIQGFGSIIEPISYALDKPGINLILGKNGRGKSTIFNALTWCIWGKLLKPDSSWKPWPSIADKKYPTQVTLSFRKAANTASIVRGEKFTHLYINGDYEEQYRTRTDVQAEIERIIGISFNLAKNSIIFGQKLTRLLSQKGEVQKQLFDEAFEASFINDAKQKVNQDYNTTNTDFTRLHLKYEELKYQFKTEKEARNNIIDFFTNHQGDIIRGYGTKIAETMQLIKNMEADKDQYEATYAREQTLAASIEAMNKKLEKVMGLEKKKFKIEITKEQIEAEAKGLIEEKLAVHKRLTSKNPECPTCGQPVDPNGYKRRLKARDAELSELIITNTEELKRVSADEQEVISSLRKYQKLRESKKEKSRELDNLLQLGYDDISYHPERMKRAQIDLKKLEDALDSEINKKPPIDLYTQRLKKIKEEAFIIKPQYQEKKKLLNKLNWLLKDPFSNSGLKAYIFNSMLSQVNDRLALYSRFTGFSLTLNIDLESARKNFECIIHKGEQMIVYSELSGGEAQLADVMLAFAIHDIMSAEGKFNILILDEIFESLDEDNIETILDMLKEKGRHLSLHLITHIKKLATIKTTQVITLVKQNGITRLA